MATRALGPRGSRRRHWFLLAPISLLATAMVLVVGQAGAANQGGFEIDAANDNATHSPALYSGTLPSPGDDWAPGSTQQGVFSASSTGNGIAQPGGASCYGSTIFRGLAPGAAAFVCDGSSDSKLSAFPEQNIVSPSGKTPDASWPIKPGNVRPKNDFSHAYIYGKTAHSPCNPDPNSQDPVLYLGGHVGDNEGDHFWGFEFDRTAPTNFNKLDPSDPGFGTNFTLNFNRSIGDILVSITVPGSGPPQLEIFKVTAIDPVTHTATFTPAGALPGCPAGAPRGLSEVSTNTINDILAPPWNVPVCDPTSEDPANTCRLANGTNVAPADKLLAQRDFAEASVDLFAFGINPCFSNVLFTSRSAHPLEGADVQDVGGATLSLCGSKSGTKFEDLNGNGVKDSGEPGLQGWPIKLYKDAGTIGTLDAADDSDPSTPGIQPFMSSPTAADGSYTFGNVLNGKYIVCEAKNPPVGNPGGLPTSGWKQSLPNNATPPPSGETTADCTADNTLGNVGYAFTMTGQRQKDNDFGNFQPGTKSGSKFNDKNANGVRNLPEDVGIAGWTIRAYKDDGAGGGTAGDGILQAGETTIAASATTGVGGDYTLTLDPGTYVVCEVLQASWFQSAPGNGKCSAINPGAGVGAGGFAVTITSRSTESANLFGNFQQGTKSGSKFNDMNANGVRNLPEDVGLAGWTIRAYKDDGAGGGTAGDGILQAGETTIAASATTDASGDYTLTLDPGTYVVCEVLQASWFQSAPGNGKCSAINPGAGVGAGGFAVTITSGSSESGNLFGNFQQATIAGTKFKDINNNNARDAGEGGLEGWTIHVYDDNGGTTGSLDATDALVDTQVTDGNGAYTSDALSPGTYYVCEVGQSNWIQTYPQSSTAGSTDCSAKDGGQGWKVVISSGANATVKDFGNTPQSHVTVNFFSDAKLSGGGDATKATSITCVDKSNASLDDQDPTGNGYTSPKVTLDQSALVCTITFTDP
jgi:hypothetical protein